MSELSRRSLFGTSSDHRCYPSNTDRSPLRWIRSGSDTGVDFDDGLEAVQATVPRAQILRPHSVVAESRGNAIPVSPAIDSATTTEARL